MKTIFIVLLAAVAVSAYPKNQKRIVGGELTTINQYPSIAALLYSWGVTGHSHACGGTIINNRSILTAAHCTSGDDPARWISRVGSTNSNSGGVVHTTSLIFNHPQYDSFTVNNDIAIIHITGTFTFNNNVSPGAVAGSNYNPGDNQVVWAAGWGSISSGGPLSPELRHVQIWTVNQNVCQQRYGSVSIQITNNMLCSGWLDVGGRDQCQGDSGGPLYHNGVVVGVCSFGIGCGDPFFPGVNARVSSYTAWISANA